MVQFLPATPEFAKIAEAFSKSDLASHSIDDYKDPFNIGGWITPNGWPLPVLDGTLGRLLCKVDRMENVGDHRLWIGMVEKSDVNESLEETALGYRERMYRKGGPIIWPHDATNE